MIGDLWGVTRRKEDAVNEGSRGEWVRLNNDVLMPKIGLGMACAEPGEGLDALVHAAIEAGYRLFDNAPLYGNEPQVGGALGTAGIPRDQLFISSKLPNSKHSYEDALKAFDESRKNLGVDYLDLYLIHWPVPALDMYTEAWKALEHLHREGFVKAIGVSNFHEHHLAKLLQACEIKPVVNQLECNPYLAIEPLRRHCLSLEIMPEAWFPLGGPAVPLKGSAPDRVLLEDPLVRRLAEQYGRTPAQMVLRWHVQSSVIPVPKTSRPKRLVENISVFDFAISDEDMALMDGLDYGRRVGPHPDECNDLF